MKKLQPLLAKQDRSLAQEAETIALLEEDELDRHNCFGNWSWSAFEGGKVTTGFDSLRKAEGINAMVMACVCM